MLLVLSLPWCSVDHDDVVHGSVRGKGVRIFIALQLQMEEKENGYPILSPQIHPTAFFSFGVNVTAFCFRSRSLTCTDPPNPLYTLYALEHPMHSTLP